NVAAVARPAVWTLSTPVLQVDKPTPRPGPTRRFELRVDPGFPARVDLVAGRLPGAAVPAGTGPTRVEAVISAQAAPTMKLRLGDSLPVGTVLYDSRMPPVRVRIVGLFKAKGPDDAWLLDPRALVPWHTVSEQFGDIWTGVAYLGPAALPVLQS